MSISRTDKVSPAKSESREDEAGGSWEMVDENDLEDWVWVPENKNVIAKVAKSLCGRFQEIIQNR